MAAAIPTAISTRGSEKRKATSDQGPDVGGGGAGRGPLEDPVPRGVGERGPHCTGSASLPLALGGERVVVAKVGRIEQPRRRGDPGELGSGDDPAPGERHSCGSRRRVRPRGRGCLLPRRSRRAASERSPGPRPGPRRWRRRRCTAARARSAMRRGRTAPGARGRRGLGSDPPCAHRCPATRRPRLCGAPAAGALPHHGTRPAPDGAHRRSRRRTAVATTRRPAGTCIAAVQSR